MSIKRRDLVRYFEENGFHLLREGGKHSILQMEGERFRLRDTGVSIGSRQTNYVSKPG